jgi:translation initiation factor IF-1
MVLIFVGQREKVVYLCKKNTKNNTYMRTMIRTFILLMAFGLSVQAMAQGTTLTVFTEKGENFTVYLNGDMKNSKPGDHVVVEGIHGPTAKVRILFQDANIKLIEKTIFNSPSGQLFYVLKQSKPGVYVMEKTSSDFHNQSTKTNSTTTTTTTATTETKTKETTSSSNASATKSTGGCLNPMSEGDFQASTIAISNAPFDGIRLTQEKKLVETHCLYCRQIIEALYILSAESSRLTIAKDAYKHCYDPENYSQVKDALRSNKSKDDLDRYIESLK